MTAWLDESVPMRLARTLATHGCRVLKFPDASKGLKNGQLLAELRRQGIACLVTCDKNFEYQQSIATSGIALVVLPRQRFPDLVPLAPSIAEAVTKATPGETILIDEDGLILRR